MDPLCKGASSALVCAKIAGFGKFLPAANVTSFLSEVKIETEAPLKFTSTFSVSEPLAGPILLFKKYITKELALITKKAPSCFLHVNDSGMTVAVLLEDYRTFTLSCCKASERAMLESEHMNRIKPVLQQTLQFDAKASPAVSELTKDGELTVSFVYLSAKFPTNQCS